VKAIVVHMPAMNTPQFRWVKSRLPNLPQPVPPIYKPEVGADVVLHAARTVATPGILGGRLNREDHRRTEIYSWPPRPLPGKDPGYKAQ